VSAPDAGPILRELKGSASAQYRADMAARYGIVTRAVVYGVPVAKLRAMAKRLGSDHAMAGALWRTGVHDARMLATMVDDPERVTAAQMDRWARDFDNWALVDTACFSLFDRTPHAFGRIDRWAGARDEFVKRAAFALLACAALHGRGSDADHLRGLGLIERAAGDPRNFVKKGVSWALRSIGGKRSPALRAAARDLSRKLAASEDPTERWIGKDALRALARG
jgi:3-methyladenine DNA glycosylase AlkD